jgi:hypothetical protein
MFLARDFVRISDIVPDLITVADQAKYREPDRAMLSQRKELDDFPCQNGIAQDR